MSVKQAIGTGKDKLIALEFLRQFVKKAKESGLIIDLINRHRVDKKIKVAT